MNAVDCFIKQEARRQLAERGYRLTQSLNLAENSMTEEEAKERAEWLKKNYEDIQFEWETEERIEEDSTLEKILFGVHSVMSMVGTGLCGYHGYKRNRGSIGWTLGWAALGTGMPIVGTAIALAQGFGKPLKK
jgi:hypothetical protein